jgi:hypothetical protein
VATANTVDLAALEAELWQLARHWRVVRTDVTLAAFWMKLRAYERAAGGGVQR